MSRLHPDDRTGVLAATIRSETTGEPFAMEFRYLHKDGPHRLGGRPGDLDLAATTDGPGSSRA